jgi:two-component system osmolarity sensor histidine kinase EnvZ
MPRTSHIFLVGWAVVHGAAGLVAILFLRNQIRPILPASRTRRGSARAATMEFRPRGAGGPAGGPCLPRDEAAHRAAPSTSAPTMLNGVSHDLRTIMTRFKLSAAPSHEQTP